MAETDVVSTIAQELRLSRTQVVATVALFDDGNTIPFVARYRKEMICCWPKKMAAPWRIWPSSFYRTRCPTPKPPWPGRGTSWPSG
jgi:hypothetical protein